MRSLGIYIHIPFCESRCYYCDFCSNVLDSYEQINKYVKYLNREIDILANKGFFQDHVVDTIYFGGGTPSLLESSNFDYILKNIKSKCNTSLKEITLEANPNSLTEKKLDGYIASGLNRISIGVQSLNDKTLKSIGRLHNRSDAIKSIELACSKKINVSTDLMLGIPYQTKTDLKDYVDTVLSYDVKHISTYMLSVEDNTKLQNMINEKIISVSNDDEKIDLFNYVEELLENKNLHRYEVSNFACKDYESKHNMKYWELKDYIGVGLSAHSLIGNYRFYNSSNFEKYYGTLDEDQLPSIVEENLSNKDLEEEYIMLGFRTSNGINFEEYKSIFKKDFLIEYSKAINMNKNCLNLTDKAVSIKNQYLNVMNKLVLDFLD